MLELLDWDELPNPKTLLPVLGNEDDGAREELLTPMLENKDELASVEELLLLFVLIPDVIKADGALPLPEKAKVVIDELLLPVCGNMDSPRVVEFDMLNGDALAGSVITTDDLGLSNDVGTEIVLDVPAPNWKEGIDTAEDIDGAEFDVVAVLVGKIELAGVSESLVSGVAETENVGEDVPNVPLLRVGLAEAPKENMAGVTDIDNPEEAVLPNDLNRSPDFCVSPPLIKLDPSAGVIVA